MSCSATLHGSATLPASVSTTDGIVAVRAIVFGPHICCRQQERQKNHAAEFLHHIEKLQVSGFARGSYTLNKKFRTGLRAHCTCPRPYFEYRSIQAREKRYNAYYPKPSLRTDCSRTKSLCRIFHHSVRILRLRLFELYACWPNRLRHQDRQTFGRKPSHPSVSPIEALDWGARRLPHSTSVRNLASHRYRHRRGNSRLDNCLLPIRRTMQKREKQQVQTTPSAFYYAVLS